MCFLWASLAEPRVPPLPPTDDAARGRYTMAIDPDTKTMQGSTKGKPEDWRKASYVKDLAVKAGAGEHDHLHNH